MSGEKPNPEHAAAIADQLAPLGRIAASRLFGGYGFKAGGVNFAMLIGGTLYLRADEALARALEAEGSVPFNYTTRRGRVEVRSYWSAPDSALDDDEALQGWARQALAAARANAGADPARPQKRRRKAKSRA